ncbi:hypothetical protein K438DRAFT_262756 [Mycena galopus ATCC 62051]|nr:hypothetical protein K438DRAFT_262756 [Mycena galopus ATCC 62051]
MDAGYVEERTPEDLVIAASAGPVAAHGRASASQTAESAADVDVAPNLVDTVAGTHPPGRASAVLASGPSPRSFMLASAAAGPVTPALTRTTGFIARRAPLPTSTGLPGSSCALDRQSQWCALVKMCAVVRAEGAVELPSALRPTCRGLGSSCPRRAWYADQRSPGGRMDAVVQTVVRWLRRKTYARRHCWHVARYGPRPRLRTTDRVLLVVPLSALLARATFLPPVTMR